MDREALKRELAELEAKNAAATSWGAAVGARHERIKGIRAALSASHAQGASARPIEDPELCWHTAAEAEGELVVTQYELAAARTALREIAGMSHNCRSVDIAKAALESSPVAPKPGWLQPALDKAAERAGQMPDWMVRGAPDDRPHRIMTREEYNALPLQGWHMVCHDVDGSGSTGVRYLSGPRTPAEDERPPYEDLRKTNVELMAKLRDARAQVETANARLRQLKDSIDTRINDLLCETKPGYDDSVVGINDAWDVVRKACDLYIAMSHSSTVLGSEVKL